MRPMDIYFNIVTRRNTGSGILVSCETSYVYTSVFLLDVSTRREFNPPCGICVRDILLYLLIWQRKAMRNNLFAIDAIDLCDRKIYKFIGRRKRKAIQILCEI